MGIHTFERAEHLRVWIGSRRKDEPDPNKRTFDSDPRRSIPMAFGFHPLTYRAELIHSGSDGQKFNVYGASREDETPTFRGTLYTKSMDRVRRESDYHER